MAASSLARRHLAALVGEFAHAIGDRLRRIGKVLEENGVFWYEEPFTPEDIDSYAALRGSVGVRIAAGENEFGVQGFRELIRAKTVDIVQPDACRCGGISETVKVAKMAAAGFRFKSRSQK